MPTKPLRRKLSERQREILQAVVEDYIATAEPVGSRTLTKRNTGIDVSPATVRNAMADLEELGYLVSPHASSGRIPTAQAIRFYVEELASRGRLSPRDKEIIQAVTSARQDPSRDIAHILRDASRVLSSLAHHATVVLLPRLDDVIFADIEFVPVRQDSVLALFVAKSGFVQHRVIQVSFPISRDELREMSNYLKSLLGGKTLAEIRAAIIDAMRNERVLADQMMQRALTLGEKSITLDTNPTNSVFVDGERNFFDQPEFSDIARMRELLRAFEEKTVLLKLLNSAIQNPVDAHAAERTDTQIVFGAEASVQETKNLALVVASYAAHGGPVGQVGVVGPMRMDYSRVIPLVEYTAGALSQSLSDDDDEKPDS